MIKKDEDVQLMELYKKTMDNVNMSPYKKDEIRDLSWRAMNNFTLTGDVYSVPKRGGGEPEWVGNVKY